jgi:hypothetical protein
MYAPTFIFATIIPVSLANLFLYRKRGWDAATDLWRSVFDYKRIGNKLWYIPIFLLMAATSNWWTVWQCLGTVPVSGNRMYQTEQPERGGRRVNFLLEALKGIMY